MYSHHPNHPKGRARDLPVVLRFTPIVALTFCRHLALVELGVLLLEVD